MSEKYYAALDVGGTKIYTVIANTKLQIVARQQMVTESAAGPEAVMEQMLLSLRQTMDTIKLKKENLLSVGVCIAGFYDWQNRLLIHSPNLSGWNRVPLGNILAQRIGLPVLVENDANAAALGEARLGAGYGHSNVIFITVSTGIGAGLILNSSLYRGQGGLAGEIGHMVVVPGGPLCGCGQRGCLEAVASGTAIAHHAQFAASSDNSSSLNTLAQQKKITAKDVFAAAANNDLLAQNIVEKAFFYLGIGLANIINLLNPAVIVIGGGIFNNLDETFYQSLQKTINAHSISAAEEAVELKPALLGTEAGVKGMLSLLEEKRSSSISGTGKH